MNHIIWHSICTTSILFWKGKGSINNCINWVKKKKSSLEAFGLSKNKPSTHNIKLASVGTRCLCVLTLHIAHPPRTLPHTVLAALAPGTSQVAHGPSSPTSTTLFLDHFACTWSESNTRTVRIPWGSCSIADQHRMRCCARCCKCSAAMWRRKLGAGVCVLIIGRGQCLSYTGDSRS